MENGLTDISESRVTFIMEKVACIKSSHISHWAHLGGVALPEMHC